MSYTYQTQFDSPNYTPGNQTMATWGVPRQIRDIVIHWWGDPNTNPTYEGVIAHFQNPNSQVSAHYVATGTGRRVACLVSPADNAWATDAENPYSIAIECDPRCRPEDYDVVAELIADIRSAYGDMPLKPHKEFWNTACPGDWDLARLDSIALTKVSHDQWGQVTDATIAAPATAADVAQAYIDILERPADPSGLHTYTTNGMTIEQVRLDLHNSTEYKSLQNKKAAESAAAIAAAQKAAQDSSNQKPQQDKPANTEYSKLGQPMNLVLNKDTQMWDLGFADDAHATSVEALAKGVAFRAFGKAQRTDGDHPAYFMREEDFGAADTTGIPNRNVGVNTVDLSPAPTPTTEAPTVPTVTPAPDDKVPIVVGTWQSTYVAFLSPQKYLAQINVEVHEINVESLSVDPHPASQQLIRGQTVMVAGTFTRDGAKYYRTVNSVLKNHWYGIPVTTVVKVDENMVEESFDKMLESIGYEVDNIKAAEKQAATKAGNIIGGIFHKK